MEFVDAAYIPTKGGAGRPAGPNPYKDVIAAIALKQGPDGKPLAKAVVLDVPFGTEAANKAVAAAKRVAGKAGHANTPAVTVYGKGIAYTYESKGKSVIDKTKTLFTFWTAPKQNRPRTAKTAETPAK